MKIVLISDTHNRHNHLTSKAAFSNKLPDGDLLLHAGDLTGVGAKSEVESVIEWMYKNAKRFTHGIVFVAGNHDRSFDPKFGEYEINDEMGEKPKVKPIWLRNILSNIKSDGSGITYLENESVNIGGLNIWGSPISPWFHGDRWAFNKHRGDDIQEVWNLIPANTDIIVTHTPVAYKCDYIPRDEEYAGCENLRKTIKQIKPILHVGGHIHEGYGMEYDEDTIYANAAICNLMYEPVNKPWEVIIDPATREIDVL